MRVVAIVAGLLLAGVTAAQPVPWYFVVTAVNSNGAESLRSNEASKVMGPGDSVTLGYVPPTLNADGSPLTNLAGYRFYAGTTPGSYPISTSVNNPALTSFVWTDFAGSPTLPLGNPTQAPSFTYTVTLPTAASVTVTNVNQFAEFDLELVGATDFRLNAPSGTVFDYCGTTTPPIGTNNEGVTAPAITIRGPVSVRCDLDAPATFAGFSVTVAGVTKALVQSGATWNVQFP